MKFDIEFDPSIVPKKHNPVEFRTPKIGETILIFINGKSAVIRNDGNICYGPVFILERIK